MFIFWLSPNKKKKKNYTILEFGKLEYCVIFFFKKGTRAWYTQVLCKWYSSLPSSSTAKIQLSNATLAKLMRNSSFWNSSSRKSGTLPKQCFFAKNFQKLWYWAILAVSKGYGIVFLAGPDYFEPLKIWPKHYTIAFAQHDMA